MFICYVLGLFETLGNLEIEADSIRLCQLEALKGNDRKKQKNIRDALVRAGPVRSSPIWITKKPRSQYPVWFGSRLKTGLVLICLLVF